MPLFGLFNSKKYKKSANGIATSTNGRSNASAASQQDDESIWESISPTTQSHIHGDDMPSEPAPPSSRLKMPFQRRKASVSAVASLPQTSPSRPQREPNPYMSNSSADVTEKLRPPMKSAIFSSYSEASGSSTRSLPTTTRTAPDTFSYQDMADDTSREASQPKKKSGGLLTWARERTKSKPSSPPVIPAETFNLRTFRHIRPDSPSVQSEHPSTDLSLEPPPARPRPRGHSVVSDSSQRISVAAFREAQARRSTANSPVPSFRPPSSTDTLTTRALTPTRSALQIDKTRTQAAARRSIVPDSSSSSNSSSEEESDDDALPNSHLGRRKRTITKRPARAQTDIGHGQQHSSHNEPARRSMVAIQPSPTNPQMISGGSRAPSNMGAYGKSRGSVSTTALDSNRRSSVDFPARKVPSQQRHSSDSSSSSSSESDSDDAPLASLVGPRRPGSAMSGASNPRSRAPSRPLIDIKTLVTDQTVLSSSPVSATRDQAMNRNNSMEMEREDVTGLAKLAALARQAAEAEDRSQSPSPPPKVVQPQPKVALSKPVVSNLSRSKHRRSSSDIVTSLSTGAVEAPHPVSRGQEASVAPARIFAPELKVVTRVISPEPNEVDDDDIMPALRFMMPKTYPTDGDSASAVDSLAKDDARIVPTPIRQRIPPSSFSVTSRPQHRTQQSSNSILTAPSSTSTLTSPTIIPKIVSSTASTSMTSLASKTTSPRPGRARSSALTISTDPLLSSSSSNTSSPSSSPTLPPSVSKRPVPTSTKSTPVSPVKSTTSTSQSESSGLTRRSRARSGSTTLISQIPPSASLNPDSRPQALSSSKNLSRPDTLVSRIPTPSSTVSTAKPKPFAGSAIRRESPASSTGDSSSGRLPLTPRDGSDFGGKDNWDRVGHLSSGPQQGRDNKEHKKKRSVSFGEDFDFERGRDKGIARERERERERERAESVETPMEGENRRRDRRRSEARAAIELGNVINGRRPIDEDEDEDENSDLVHNNLGPQFNPMLAMGAGPMGFSNPAGPPGWNHWQQQGQPSPGLMPPLPNQYGQDANFLAAHQQAMMIAKQTYQMAVAQQALAAAGDEWERNSNVSGFGGNQGFAPNPGFGFGGPNVNMGMFGMGGGMGGYGSGMGMPNWSNASLMAHSGPRSAYGGVFGGAQSEYGGGPGGSGGWGSRSMYGESFGPSPGDRASRAFSAAPLGQPRQQQQTSFPSSKGSRERERRNESSGQSNRADGGSSSSGQHIRPGPRLRTLTAPSSSPHQVKMRRPQPPASPPPSSFRRFNGA